MERSITITRILDAPRERVWRAWTDPKEVAQWWGPSGVTNPVCEVDAKVGGELYIVMLAGEELGSLAGQRWPMRGTFTQVQAPERLAFINRAVDDKDNALLEGTTEVLLEHVAGPEGAGKTKLTITTSARGVSPLAPQMLAGMEQGWNQQCDKLVMYVAASK